MRAKVLLLSLVATLLIGCKTDNSSFNPQPTPYTGILTLSNESDLYYYTFYIDNKQYKIAKGDSKSIALEPGSYDLKVEQSNGYPTSGKFAGLKATYNHENLQIHRNKSYNYKVPKRCILRINNNDSSHSYDIVINGETVISKFNIPKNSHQLLTLDAGYYHIEQYQQDYLFYPSDYVSDIYLYQNESINVLNIK